MPLTDEQKREKVWVYRNVGGFPGTMYHARKVDENEMYELSRGDAEALNLKPCTLCYH